MISIDFLNRRCGSGVFTRWHRGVWLSLLVGSVSSAAALVIPPTESGFYYQLGGGQDVPLPAFYDKSYVPLRVEARVGLGMNCGAFNPVLSLSNSLNQIKGSITAISHKVISSATAAVTMLPLYVISRADPSLYNLLTSALVGAEKTLALSTKSCEVMQSQIAAGQNPYAHWMTLSMGDHWQREIGTAGLSTQGSDINVAKTKVDSDAGRGGVAWVDIRHLLNRGALATVQAGGVRQAPVRVIHDTVVAGFQVIQSVNGDADNASNNAHDDPSDATLIHCWASAEAAAAWVVRVVGEQTITTYDAGEKSSTPGVGLYTEIATVTRRIAHRLGELITDQQPANIAQLTAVSAAGVAVTPELIHMLQAQSPVIRLVLQQKLAHNIAALRVMNQARLAMRLLQTGQHVPVIYRNAAAQAVIQAAEKSLSDDVSHLLLWLKAKNQLATQLMDTVMQAGHRDQDSNAALAATSPATLLEHGALRVPSAATTVISS